MFNWKITGLAAAMACGMALPALAADIVEPAVVEAQAQPQPIYEDAAYGGWYLRGDVGYSWNRHKGADYIIYGAPGIRGSFDTHDVDDSWLLGGGIGYQINRNFRVDLTGDYLFDSKFHGSTSGYCGSTGLPCTSVDTAKYNAFLMLANAYVDLGTYHGFTPYVGAGIGGAHVKWSDLNNTDDDGSFNHPGEKQWRFAYALMAGASYCVSDNTSVDVGYRYAHMNGGNMFGYQIGAGPGFDHGLDSHEVRAGLRYQFGKSSCAPAPVAYAPEPAPVYKQ